MTDEPKPELSHYLQLRRRLQKFVDYYIETGSRSEAMRRLGNKGKSPEKVAWHLMQRPHVKQAIEERTAQAIEEAGVTAFRTMREVSRVAFFDHRKLYNPDGSLIPVHELPDDMAAGLAQIEIETLTAGRGDKRHDIGTLTKYRGWPKVDALKLLAQYQKLIVEKHEHTGKDGVPLAPPVINIGFGNGGPGEPDPSPEGS